MDYAKVATANFVWERYMYNTNSTCQWESIYESVGRSRCANAYIERACVHCDHFIVALSLSSAIIAAMAYGTTESTQLLEPDLNHIVSGTRVASRLARMRSRAYREKASILGGGLYAKNT